MWRTQDAGSSWRRLERGLPQQDAHLGVLREGMAIDSYDVPGLYFGTSTGQVFASADEGESWDEIASYLPAISSVEVAVLGVAMADVHLPATLPPLFRDLPRRVDGRGRDRRRGDRAARRSAGPACATGSASPGPRCGGTSTCTSTASAPGSTRRSPRTRAST